ncbi:hypothetical protein CDAR_553871 [Caerostris darwini]|uniref:Uncharacterized protein n=1 Tax=Caerostris darwini TaxID=1538125 RepID=A0AAV4WM35_9ARAC|nr:hypothetical protein CDAR_553871 [Caerostris darwini]
MTLDIKQAVNKNISKFCSKRGPQGDRARPSILKAPSPQAMSSSPQTIQTRTHNNKKKGRQKIAVDGFNKSKKGAAKNIILETKETFKESSTEGHWRLQALMSSIWPTPPFRGLSPFFCSTTKDSLFTLSSLSFV